VNDLVAGVIGGLIGCAIGVAFLWALWRWVSTR
jgi:ABC-type lipoprotein release transport system permease subunit